MVARTRNRRRGGRRRRRRVRRRNKGRGYNSTGIRRRRTGRGVLSNLKKVGRFALKHQDKIIKGARFLAKKSGNKTIQKIANSGLVDKGAQLLQRHFGEGNTSGRGMSKGRKKKRLSKKKARAAVRSLIRKYGKTKTKRMLNQMVKNGGRGFVGQLIGGLAQGITSLIPF